MDNYFTVSYHGNKHVDPKFPYQYFKILYKQTKSRIWQLPTIELCTRIGVEPFFKDKAWSSLMSFAMRRQIEPLIVYLLRNYEYVNISFSAKDGYIERILFSSIADAKFLAFDRAGKDLVGFNGLVDFFENE